MEPVVERESVIGLPRTAAELRMCFQCGTILIRSESPKIWDRKTFCSRCHSKVTKGKPEATPLAVPDPSTLPIAYDLPDHVKPMIGIGLASIPFFIAALGWLIFHHAGPYEVAPQSTRTISVQYDKFRDWTDVSTGAVAAADQNSTAWQLVRSDGHISFRVASDPVSAVYLSVSYGFHGQTLSRIQFGPMFRFAGNLVRDDDQVIFLIDGEQRMSFFDVFGRPLLNQNYGWIRQEDVATICNAKSVEVQIGNNEYKMTAQQQQAILDFMKDLGAQ